ncbi:hypothetical protein ACHAXR_007159 [Thalassiosira sp. AJA248-18]
MERLHIKGTKIPQINKRSGIDEREEEVSASSSEEEYPPAKMIEEIDAEANMIARLSSIQPTTVQSGPLSLAIIRSNATPLIHPDEGGGLLLVGKILELEDPISSKKKTKLQFPFNLYELLKYASISYSSVISWNPDGRSFVIHDPDSFMRTVAPKYFKQTRFRSFTRQLNIWGFRNLRKDGWHHPHFVRGDTAGLRLIERLHIKGSTKIPKKNKRSGIVVREEEVSESSSEEEYPPGKRIEEIDAEGNMIASHSSIQPTKLSPLSLAIGSNVAPIIAPDEGDWLLLMIKILELKGDTGDGCSCSFCCS